MTSPESATSSSSASSTSAPSPSRSRVSRIVFATLGGLFAALGVIGIAVPLLPSTPFFLVAVACFARSSPRAYEWMLANRFFGRQLSLYHEHRGASARSKAIAIASIWIGITLSVVLVGPPHAVATALFAIATLVSAYLLRLRTIRPGDLGLTRTR